MILVSLLASLMGIGNKDPGGMGSKENTGKGCGNSSSALTV